MHRREFLRQLVVVPIALGTGCSRVIQATARPLRRIAFGSCAQQTEPQPIWEAVLAQKLDLFIFLGDNVYADTVDISELRKAYAALAAQPGFQRLRETTPIFAVWDDHDYGADDAGAEYPIKAASQRVFLEFFQEPRQSPRWSRSGVYDARVFGPPGRRVQVILLDLRYFRSPLRRTELDPERRRLGFGPYTPTDSGATLLGETQWRWLARQLEMPSEIRLIGSSVQVLNAEHGWESWGQFPHEQQRLFELIAAKRAAGVIFLSGDTHWAELSRSGGAYPLYELTSSALNQEWPQALNLPNRYRVGSVVYPFPNFGMVEIDWSLADPKISLRIHDLRGAVVLGHDVRLSELRVPRVRR